MSDRIQNFSDFWLYYIGEHRNPWCRVTHFVGTGGIFGCVGCVCCSGAYPDRRIRPGWHVGWVFGPES
ncbi:MAG: Mpo1-like protein [Myxococcota bacterium]